jgi:CRISPR/Cas system-associated exonuclease Cas4 (RecB family)
MRPVDASGSVPGHEGLAATEIGDSVHFLLEDLDLRAPRPPESGELAEAVRVHYPAATDEELERIAGLVSAYCESELALRVASLEAAAPERPFAFEHDGVLLHGRLDVLYRDGARALVVDYKTNVLEDASPEELIERDYRLQRLVYALACFRAGADEVEVVYQFLERPDPAVTTTFHRSEVTALEAELSEAIARIQEGVFKPTPSEYICAGCPVLDIVCAGPRLRQQPEASIPAEIAVG